MDFATHRMVGGVALRIPHHSSPEFWKTLIEALLDGKPSFSAGTTPHNPNVSSTADVSEYHTQGVQWVSQVYRRLALWNPWDIAQLCGTSIKVVMEQLLLATSHGGLHLVFSLCCQQCAAELGRWHSVDALLESVELLSSRQEVMTCPLCEEPYPLGTASSLASPAVLAERIKVFFAPSQHAKIEEFPLAVSGLRATAASSEKTPTSSTLVADVAGGVGSSVSPLELVTRCDNLAPDASGKILASMPYWPHAAKDLPYISRRLFLPADKYLVLLPDIGVSFTMVVASAPDTREMTPVVRVTVSILELISQRRRRRSTTPLSSPVECRHGHIVMDVVNETNVCGVIHILPWRDTRTAWRTAPTDLTGPSNQRLFALSTLMFYIPGGLANTPLWDLCAPRSAPSSSITSGSSSSSSSSSLATTVLQLPASTVTCALNLSSSMKYWNTVSAQRRHDCVQELLHVLVGMYHGLVVETSAAFETIVVLFRSPSFATSALLAAAQRLATVYRVVEKTVTGQEQFLQFLPADGIPFSIVLEGSVLLGRHATETSSLHALPIPAATQGVQFYGAAIRYARWMANVGVLDASPRGASASLSNSWIVAYASVSSQVNVNNNSDDRGVGVCSVANLSPFVNRCCGDVLLAALWDALPFRFEGLTVDLPRENIVVELTPQTRSFSHLLTNIFGNVPDCLGATECLSLPTVLDPSMVDPHHVSCSDSV
ncbi:Hypothetical protein, putative [Bodo saltans]|uniref:Uncharacterized protein n=1 Tax=Bodo saltans TaxID=75058 RepID=A0A0S4JKB0_BODSA|nr:Hypothetical protein, putative [Bodo saltans]|eukprot:CUG89629.1 Hypothetical protein, putative [Bodo saltans]